MIINVFFVLAGICGAFARQICFLLRRKISSLWKANSSHSRSTLIQQHPLLVTYNQQRAALNIGVFCKFILYFYPAFPSRALDNNQNIKVLCIVGENNLMSEKLRRPSKQTVLSQVDKYPYGQSSSSNCLVSDCSQ